jgi:hypothetical protein
VVGRSRAALRTRDPRWGFDLRFVVGRAEWDEAVEDFHLLASGNDSGGASSTSSSAAAAAAAEDFGPPPTLLEHFKLLVERNGSLDGGRFEKADVLTALDEMGFGLNADEVSRVSDEDFVGRSVRRLQSCSLNEGRRFINENKERREILRPFFLQAFDRLFRCPRWRSGTSWLARTR